jgi:hypothetical protein
MTTVNNLRAQRPPSIKPRKLSFSRSEPNLQAITFAPLAWLKLQHFLHSDDVEVGGFGISSVADLRYIEQFVTVKQAVSFASVEFDDVAVADYFDDCADREIPPARCGRVWIHTHPGNSASPSLTDEETFERVFGHCDWAVMVIVARGGATYARLRFSAGPGGQLLLPVQVDWERLSQDLLAAEGQLDELFGGWFDEYGRNVHPQVETGIGSFGDKDATVSVQQDPLDELDLWQERQALADRLESWDRLDEWENYADPDRVAHDDLPALLDELQREVG